LIRQPAIWLAVAGSAVIALLSGPESEEYWYMFLTSQPSFLLGPAAFVSVNMIASRDRRAGTCDIVAATPTRPRTQTVALLCAAIGPALLCTAIVSAMAVAHHEYALADWLSPTFAEVAVQPVIVLSGGMLGVAVARWLPYPGAPVAVLVALVGWVTVASSAHTVWFAPYGQFVYVLDSDLQHVSGRMPGSHPWHDTYVLCLGLLAATAALWATRGPKRPLLAAAIVFVAGAAVAGGCQVR
jgi:hypothetical protein